MTTGTATKHPLGVERCHTGVISLGVLGLLLSWLSHALYNACHLAATQQIILPNAHEAAWLLWLIQQANTLVAVSCCLGWISLLCSVYAFRDRPRSVGMLLLAPLLWACLLQTLAWALPAVLMWRLRLPLVLQRLWFLGWGGMLLAFLLPRESSDVDRMPIGSSNPLSGAAVVGPIVLGALLGGGVAAWQTTAPYEVLSPSDRGLLILMGAFLGIAMAVALGMIPAAADWIRTGLRNRLSAALYPWLDVGLALLMGAVIGFALTAAMHDALHTQLATMQMLGELEGLKQLVVLLAICSTLACSRRLAHGSQPQLFWIALFSMPAWPLLALTRCCCGKRWSDLLQPWHFLCAGVVAFVCLALVHVPPDDDWLSTFALSKNQILFLVALGLLQTAFTLLPLDRFWPIRFRARSGTVGVLLACLGLVSVYVYHAMAANCLAAKAALLEHCLLSRDHVRLARPLLDLIDKDSATPLGSILPLSPRLPAPRLLRLKQSGSAQRCNLVVIVVDALRADALHCMGSPRPVSPFLDRLVDDKTLFAFQNAYAEFNGTNSSVPSFLAGQPLHRPGQRVRDKRALAALNLLMAFALRQGNTCLLCATGHGVEYFFPTHPLVTELHFSRTRRGTAAEYLNAYRQAIGSLPRDESFVAYIHLFDTHNKLWRKPDAPDFGEDLRDLYDSNVAYVDRQLAHFFHQLEQTGRLGQTAILITSDHGEQFFDHGHVIHGYTLYEEDIRVPLLIRLPERRGARIAPRFLLTDALPMVLQELGYTVQGRVTAPRLYDLVQGHRYVHDPLVFTSIFRPGIAIRSGNVKLYYQRGLDIWRLYDLDADPGETRNLIDMHRPQAEAILKNAYRRGKLRVRVHE